MSGIVQALIGSMAGVVKDAFWSSVSLLLPGNGTNGAQNNTFIDSSANAFTVTRNGNTTQGTFSPFSAAAPYNAATKGGSGYFDGATDWLEPASSANLNVGTGQFTVEAWIHPISTTTPWQAIYIFGPGQTDGLYLNNANLVFYISGTGAIVSLGTVTANTWVHVAATRDSSNTLQIFLNGVAASAGTRTNNFNHNSPRIGANLVGTEAFNGYISNVRVVKGTAIYTTNFTPPSAPLTAITNTQLLLNFTNAGIIDNAMLNDLETVGNAQISTAQSKFGGSSMYFDGTGDWLTAPDATAQQLGTGDFTIEGWLRLNATGVTYGVVSKGAAATGWSVNVTSGNLLQFSYTATQLTGATSLAANTWYHFAVVRSGSGTGNLKVYVNGTVDATSAGAVTDNFNQTNTLYVGADRVGGASLNGYIDDLRITKGVARYTANFTPPAAAFPTS